MKASRHVRGIGATGSVTCDNDWEGSLKLVEVGSHEALEQPSFGVRQQ
jgi:hypothetical protein